MNQTPMVLNSVHQSTLLAIDSGMSRFQSDYPAAIELVAGGYCAWLRGNPNTWELELTHLGNGAVSVLKRPEIVDSIALEKIDDVVCRVVDGDELLGFAVRYPNGRWVAFDSESNPITRDGLPSPESVLLLFKIQEARLAELEQSLTPQGLRLGMS